MVAWLTMIVLVGQPPVVGLPVDFSGAIGGPFVVQWLAEPTTVGAEEPLTLTLRITGPGNLAEIARPPLGKLDVFKPFAVDDLDDRFVPGDPPRREFRYRVRPRAPTVTEIPRFKFVYFNPRIVPPSRGYQTTYADALPLTVKAPRRSPADIPAEVPDWMRDDPAWADVFQAEPSIVERWVQPLLDRLGVASGPAEARGLFVWPLAVVLLLFPPVICGVWFVVWQRTNPNAARLAAMRRSRAAAAAIRTLRARTDDRGRHVAGGLLSYLHARAGLPLHRTTPAEVAEDLRRYQCPDRLLVVTADILRRCDEARFARAAAAANPLIADAERVIFEWEADAWSPLGS
jgi:hypothetical protein